MKSVKLSREQTKFVNAAKEGKNILVDACIGSGKTTAIQRACRRLPGRKILYLTYNRRLYEDAKDKIGKLKGMNVTVHDYHSFCRERLVKEHIPFSDIASAPKLFVGKVKYMPKYDVVIVDEYQDLETDISEVLCRIRDFYPGYQPQFLIVGDMDQKICNRSRLDVRKFINDFMHSLIGGYEKMTFTKCYRLSAEYAKFIGQAQEKIIFGTNPNCDVSKTESMDRLIRTLSRYQPEEILVLGTDRPNSTRNKIQNRLEQSYPERFNKNTLYSSTGGKGITLEDTSHSAIFATYDSAKGLERPVSIICDFEKWYLVSRLKHGTDGTILKNIFLVAASRGKKQNIYYHEKTVKDHLTFQKMCSILKQPCAMAIKPIHMSSAFEHRMVEDKDNCYSFLDIRPEKSDSAGEISKVKLADGQVDLSPCIGIFVQACFFSNFDIDEMIIDKVIEQFVLNGQIYDPGEEVPFDSEVSLPAFNSTWSLRRKILYYTALDTGQTRYFYSIDENFVSEDAEWLIRKTLSEIFSGNESVEIPCSIEFKEETGGKSTRNLVGRVDVAKNGKVYELKFVSKLTMDHFLQTALYTVALGGRVGRIWNIRDNTRYEIRIKNREGFLKAVYHCVETRETTAKYAYLPDAPNCKSLSIA